MGSRVVEAVVVDVVIVVVVVETAPLLREATRLVLQYSGVWIHRWIWATSAKFEPDDFDVAGLAAVVVLLLL